jgi:hypothetical protein
MKPIIIAIVVSSALDPNAIGIGPIIINPPKLAALDKAKARNKMKIPITANMNASGMND